MSRIANQTSLSSPWPRRVATVLIAATFPMIWIGGLVTTYDAGMAVPDWPTTFGYNPLAYPWTTWFYGPWDLFIEHGHRLLGMVVGLVAIALVVTAWRFERRRSLRWLSVVCLLAVVAQGVLGGMRVVLADTQLAMIHGCLGPAFFAFAVALATLLSNRWSSATVPGKISGIARLQALSLITAVLAYVQLILGAQLRHLPVTSDPQQFRLAVLAHLVMAAIVSLHVLLLIIRVLRSARRESWLTRPAALMGILLGTQLMLGVGTWASKYGWPTWLPSVEFAQAYTVAAESRLQAWITTGHVAVGSLFVATSVALALRVFRIAYLLKKSPPFAPEAIRAVEPVPDFLPKAATA